ncbi:conserved domain protein [Fibrobacter succinogenes subsp. succinogenes S85]|uniref:Conserved domain protein n=2 Tax=Fibrobacter succinogenes TaxID=833 RepID=D9S7W7_FIBSS|nr:conserved domain protein [Fibrobacter succinogenes subsp. succinogenes S85]
MMIVSPTLGGLTGCPKAEIWTKYFVPFAVAKPNPFSSFHCVTVALFVMGMGKPFFRYFGRNNLYLWGNFNLEDFMSFDIVIGKKCIAISCLLLFLAACGGDDSNSVSAGDEPVSKISSSSSEKLSSSGSRVKSSSSSVQKNSSSSEKAKSSSSSSVKSSSSSESIQQSSSSQIAWSWDVPKETYLNPEIQYDTMIDSRDGKVYKIVTIAPKGHPYSETWMAENLNYADSSATPSLKGNNRCYKNVAKNCNVGGRFYTWAAAIDSVKLANDSLDPLDCGIDKYCGLGNMIRGICPEGWHLPSMDEWRRLFDRFSSKRLADIGFKSQSGWAKDGNGDDSFGFSALPVGLWNSRGDYFVSSNDFTVFWSSTESCGGSELCDKGCMNGVCFVYLDANSGEMHLYDYYKNDGFSVRCLRDNGWSWNVPKYARLNPDVTYGSMTDERDGQTYKTVVIGSQTWMAQNLNYAYTRVPYKFYSNTSDSSSWCYDNKAKYCHVGGRLYTWAAAIDSVKLANDTINPMNCGYDKMCDFTGHVQGICPSGWHLPNKDEWEVLLTTVGGGDYGRSQTQVQERLVL